MMSSFFELSGVTKNFGGVQAVADTVARCRKKGQLSTQHSALSTQQPIGEGAASA